jgi:hypothetical protein
MSTENKRVKMNAAAMIPDQDRKVISDLLKDFNKIDFNDVFTECGFKFNDHAKNTTITKFKQNDPKVQNNDILDVDIIELLSKDW